MIFELFSDKNYLIPMYIVVVVFLLFVGVSSLVFFVIGLLNAPHVPKTETMDERLALYIKLTSKDTQDDDWMHSLDTFSAKYGLLKSDEDMMLFSQYYPKIVAHPVVGKKPDVLKKFITELTKKNESIHGKDFKKKLGI